MRIVVDTNIVFSVDMDDIAFVALTAYLDAKLWTGDKQLLSGLKKHGFPNIITTEEIANMNFTDL
jgi:predicted nucleic acid-binding protein